MKTGVIFLLLAFVLSISSKKVANDNSKTNGKPTKKASSNGPSGALSSKINDVTADELNKLVEDNDFVICYFYDDDQSKAQFSKQVLKKLDKLNLPSKYGDDIPFVKISDPEEATEYGLDPEVDLPKMILFDNGIPEVYDDGGFKDLNPFKTWLKDELENKDVEVVELAAMEKVAKSGKALLVVFVEEGGKPLNHQLEEAVKRVCERFDIGIVKVDEQEAATKYGIDEFPTMVYFEDGIPTIFEDEDDEDGEEEDTEVLLEWIEEQRTSDTIEEVTEEILLLLNNGLKEYVAVFFTGPCDERATTDQECERVLKDLEDIDDELDDYGIALVTTEDIKYAGNVLGVRKFPALGIFRNGEFLEYEGSLKVPVRELLSWLIDEDTLEIPGKIEEVSEIMLERFLKQEEHAIVLFYDEEKRDVREMRDIFKSLESVDDKLDKFDKQDIMFVKCSDDGITEEFGYEKEQLPLLVYFENQIPIEYDGKLTDEREVHTWVMEEIEKEIIRTMDDPEVLDRVAEKSDNLVVIFFDKTKKKHLAFIDEMETIDDEAGEELDIFMVKVDDVQLAKKYGLFALPAIVHYEDGIPNVYDEDMTAAEVFSWLEDQKTGSYIEKVTPVMLQQHLFKKQEYIVTLFLSNCDKNKEACDNILEELEKIDEEMDRIDILFVYMDDESYATKLDIKEFPAIVLFRNGDPLRFEGHVENEMAVLKFVTDLRNLMLPGKIEEVGVPLLEYFLEEVKDVFVFLYDEDDVRSLKLLKGLEEIDDELEDEGINILKCSDDDVDEEYGVGYLPRFVYFESGIPKPFNGDEANKDIVKQWMKKELATNEIVTVSKPILEKLVEKFPTIGVIFVDDENKEEMKLVLELEKSSLDEIEEHKLTLVLIDDSEYAEELGLDTPPTLVHFSDDVPSVYYGDEAPEAVIEWLVRQKTEPVIEDVTAEILTEYLMDEEEYLAVLFSGECSDTTCQGVVEGLEGIDDEVDEIGIAFVKTRNEDYPYRTHDISSFPVLGLYRNGGDFIQYEGELEDEEAVRKWLMDEDTLKIDGKIEEVNKDLLAYMYENVDDLLVFLYDEENDRDADEVIKALENIDDDLDADNISFVKCGGGEEVGIDYGILDFPSLVFIQNGIPNTYEVSDGEEDLTDHETILDWVKEEAKTERIHEVTPSLLSKLIEKIENLVVVFYDMEEDPTVENLQKIANDCTENEIGIVKINDLDEAKSYGLEDKMPGILYFEKKIPSLMDANIEDEDEVLEWILKRKTTTTIHEVTDAILTDLVEEHEYVAVYFQGDDCEQNKEVNCKRVLAGLETIDDELEEIGILTVTTEDTEVASDNGVRDLPAIGLFRNGQLVVYEGDETNERLILNWLTDEETLKIIGIIDEVNIAMLENILDDEDDAFVFFYEDNDTDAHTILEELEQIDEKLDKQDLAMVKISDEGAIDNYGIETLPALVYFENGVPEIYEGDLLNDGAVLKWMKSELKQEEIKEITVLMLDKLVERGKTMAVLFYDPNDNQDLDIMDELEKIDDECRRFEIDFVKVSDASEAKEYGIDELPGLLYFENKIPSMYDGELKDEDELLKWLIEQKMTDTIEEVTEEILKMLIEDEEYLAVYFSGPCDDPEDDCAKILEDLESVDSTMQDYGIMLVTTEERELAKQHEVRSFPALGLFKNGDYLAYEGDLHEEMDILEWITDRSTLEISGKIEKVNSKMLDTLISTESDILVFMYRQNNLNDQNIVDELEHIDDELEEKGIELVKCSDKGVEKEYGFSHVPLLIYFQNEIPNAYDGELDDENEVLKWLFDTMAKSEIEEVTGPVLDVLIERLDNLAVIFFDNEGMEDEDESGADGENDGEDNDENEKDGEEEGEDSNDETDASDDDEDEEETDDESFVKQMETLDDDMDNISVPLIKISDESKALQFGLDKLPTIVYFKNQIPGLFDGDVTDTASVLEWLTSRKTEDNIQLVSDTILEDVVENFPYVACLFTGVCAENDKDCQDHLEDVISDMETINDDIENDAGIVLVMNKDRKLAKKEYGISKFPALGLFKNGAEADNFVAYDGDLRDVAAVLNWLSDTETMEIAGQIEHVNEDMLRNVIESEDDVLVFFHDESDEDEIEEILAGLERIDDDLDKEEVEFLRCSDDDIIDQFGLNMLPSLVYFEAGIPTVYESGDLKNHAAILGWVTTELRRTTIRELEDKPLESALERLEYVAVIFYDETNSNDLDIIDSYESINDECKQNDIRLVKTSDDDLRKETGIPDDSPILIYYENDVPFLYNVHPLDPDETDETLNWLIEQRNTAAIEEVTDAMLEDIIDDNEYVAVLFTGTCAPSDEEEEECRNIVDTLEKIDTILDEHGIVFVKTAVGQLEKAKEHWISRFPSLGYFRNGEYLKFKGDLKNEKSVLKWLTNDKAIMLPDQIEEVNELMLSKLLLRKKSNMFVFFYDDDEVYSHKIIRGLEKLDDELHSAQGGIDLVKISDEGIEEEYDECDDLPCLVHFKYGKPAVTFYGDLKEDEEVQQWIEVEMSKKR